MKLKLSFILICAVIALSGCETLKQIKAENDQKLLNLAKESCSKYGFAESTDSFANCVQKEINEIKNRSAIESASKNVNDK
ncbi:hypothetical protein [Paraglaciecola sp. 25GB23A]|uniref:hypothetical protein n=1 Tax=Paraglaciecola sp. 25GB23A TaxID=3156068 RepID=UPI0032AFEAE1